MKLHFVGHRSDPETAWARLGDSDFMNRQAGGGAVQMHLEPVEGQPPRITGVRQGPLGVAMPFVETSYGWVWGRWFRQSRIYPGGPLAENRYSLHLEPDGDGVIPRMVLTLKPRNMLLWPIVSAAAAQYRTRWQGLLDALPSPGQPSGPAVQRALSADGRAALERWRALGPLEVVECVEQLFREERMVELQKMRPSSLADRFGVERPEMLRGLLRGVQAGAVELYWSVRCGRCHGQISTAGTLSDLADHAHCDSCQIDVAVDLAQTVEVVFAPHPSVMPRVEQRFCTFFPAGAPTQRVRVLLEPGESLDETFTLPAGRWRLGDGASDGEVRAVPEGGEASIVWPREGIQRVGAGRVRLRAENDGEVPRVLELTAAEPGGAWISAAEVATVPEFRRELGAQVLAPNLRIGSRRVALLFSDLSGSTALYEGLGDAEAFALVRDHFHLLDEEIARHGGDRVKTIGDAVMASFPTARQAMQAALSMQRLFDGWLQAAALQPAPRLNVGVHVGRALAVHTDASGLDWFGRTVNLAARTQSAARDGALVWTEAVMEAPGVADLLKAQPRPVDAFQAALKGIGEVRLYRMDAAATRPQREVGREQEPAPADQ